MFLLTALAVVVGIGLFNLVLYVKDYVAAKMEESSEEEGGEEKSLRKVA